MLGWYLRGLAQPLLVQRHAHGAMLEWILRQQHRSMRHDLHRTNSSQVLEQRVCRQRVELFMPILRANSVPNLGQHRLPSVCCSEHSMPVDMYSCAVLGWLLRKQLDPVSVLAQRTFQVCRRNLRIQ